MMAPMCPMGSCAQRCTEHNHQRRPNQGNFAAKSVADDTDKNLSDDITLKSEGSTHTTQIIGRNVAPTNNALETRVDIEDVYSTGYSFLRTTYATINRRSD